MSVKSITTTPTLRAGAGILIRSIRSTEHERNVPCRYSFATTTSTRLCGYSRRKCSAKAFFARLSAEDFTRSRPKNRTGNKLKQSAAPASSLARRPNARGLSRRRAERRCHGAERLGVAHSRARVEFRLNRDGKMHQPRSLAGDFGRNAASALFTSCLAGAKVESLPH